jgi:Glycosyl hydrolase family 71
MPSASELFASQKKVFAHYFYPFPVSLDNVTPAKDYYNLNYLSRTGESSKWAAQGGYLRQRPLGSNPIASSNWQVLNMEAEVRQAIARGITGFTFDVMSADEGEPGSALSNMLTAAAAVDSRFKIIVMPDLSAMGADTSAIVQVIRSVANNAAAYKLADGRLVVSAFDASLVSAAWWTVLLNELSASGTKVAFVPTFLSWQGEAAAFMSNSYGFADWGTAIPSSGLDMKGDADIVHSYGKIFMMPVDSQQYRPKDFVYWEAGNSAAFRNAWTGAIEGNADWIQLVTWNDFSESGQVTPYTDATLARDIGTGYYNLNGYYAAWFLTGQQPAITHDVLYYFYRREPVAAAAPKQSQKAQVVADTGSSEDQIEVVALLTAPGQVKITIGGNTYVQNAPAGLSSFKVALQPGTPTFALARSGADVFSFQGGVQIYGAGGLPSGVQDLTYWSGSASKSGTCSL